MKLKNIFSILLSLSLALVVFPLSAFADTPTGFLDYSTLPSVSTGSDVIWGNSIQYNFDGTILQGYNGGCKGEKYYVVCEKIGLFNHIIKNGEEVTIGNFTIRYKDNYFYTLTNGVSSSKQAYISDGSDVRWGFSIWYNYGYGADPSITFYFINQSLWDKLSDYNYVLVGETVVDGGYLRMTNTPYNYSSYYVSDTNTIDLTYYLCKRMRLSDVCANVSIGDNNIPGGGSENQTYFDNLLTCANCGSHDISYRWSFVASGGSSFLGQNGYVFKCNACGCKWYGWLSPAEHEAFQAYIASLSDNTDYSLSVDNTIPLPVIPQGNVELPSDVSDFTAYLTSALGSLSAFIDSFNGFFGAVFNVLPPQVISIIILGVGFVVVIGIIKVIRG